MNFKLQDEETCGEPEEVKEEEDTGNPFDEE